MALAKILDTNRLETVAKGIGHRYNIELAMAAAAAFFTATTSLIGIFRVYNPTPFWDMWDGYLGFYLRVFDGDKWAWLAQHNEHRIFWSRILFWCDITLFGGRSIFLMVCNLVLVGATMWTFWKILDFVAIEAERRIRVLVGLLIAAWLCSWMQQENLTGAFQSQFFLAQLVPLWAFCFYGRSLGTAGPLRERNFILACGLGVVSVGTMANGLMTLPLMLIFGIVLRQSRARTIALGVVTAAVLAAYFLDYSPVEIHGSMKAAIMAHPVLIIRIFFSYLGNPFYHPFGTGAGRITSFVAGCCFVVLVASALAMVSRARQKNVLLLACLFFIIYVMASAIGIALGRSIFGLDSAYYTRYSTPVLMAWAALAIVYLGPITTRFRRRDPMFLSLVVVLGGFFLWYQLDALKSRDGPNEDRSLALLALTMGVHDDALIEHALHPIPQTVADYADRAIKNKISIFGSQPLSQIRGLMGAKIGADEPARPCQWRLDKGGPEETDKRFVRGSIVVEGADKFRTGHALAIVDSSRRVVGVALDTDLLNARFPWQRKFDRRDDRFRGYVLRNEIPLTHPNEPTLSCVSFDQR